MLEIELREEYETVRLALISDYSLFFFLFFFSFSWILSLSLFLRFDYFLNYIYDFHALLPFSSLPYFGLTDDLSATLPFCIIIFDFNFQYIYIYIINICVVSQIVDENDNLSRNIFL